MTETTLVIIVPTLAVVIAHVQNKATRKENRDAHDKIGQNIAGVDARAERRAEAFEKRMDSQQSSFERRMDAQQEVLQSLAREISFMAGRQAGQDRAWQDRERLVAVGELPRVSKAPEDSED